MEIATHPRVGCRDRIGMGRSHAGPGIRVGRDTGGFRGGFPQRLVFVTEGTARTFTTALKDILRKFVPDFLLKQRSIVLRLGPKAGQIYAGLRLLDVLGARSGSQRLVPPSARTFVFVCYGNIMRSAMAEFLMRQALSEAGVEEQVR